MKRILNNLWIAVVAFSFFPFGQSSAQCFLDATAYPTVICAGQQVSLSATGGCGYLMNNDFNNQTLGMGWSSTAANPVFTNPCGPGPVLWHAWVGTTASTTRTLESVSYDVSIGGCTVEWYMRYGIVPGSGPCEDPDYTDEGVHLQYSINNGGTWTDFPGPNQNPVGTLTLPPTTTNTPGSGGYWEPFSSLNDQQNSTLYYWHLYSCQVPAVAATVNTKFRFAQLSSSSSGFDAWGIDEVEIVCPTPGLDILWSTGDTVYSPSPVTLPDSPNGLPYDTMFTVLITDSIEYAYDTVYVTVNPIPSSAFTLSSDSICEGESITFTSSSPTASANYTWDIDGTPYNAQGPHTQQFNTAGSYTATLQMIDQGCQSPVTTVPFTVHPTPQVSFYPDITEGCAPLEVNFTNLTAVNTIQWNWDFGDGNTSTQESPNHIYNNPGTYDVSFDLVSDKGCAGSFNINGLIKVKTDPVASFNAMPNIVSMKDPTINFSNISIDGDTYEWDFGDGKTSTDESPVHVYEDEGSYSVCLKVTSADGCVDSICKNVRVVIDEIEIPNVITPNGDGINDIFEIKNAQYLEKGHLVIYNRWGKKVFESLNYQNNFDGANLADGTYFYVFKFKTVFREEEMNGSLTILRK